MIKYIKNLESEDLVKYKSLRESTFSEDNSFIADSPKVVNLILQSDIKILSIFATQEYYDEFEELLRCKSIPKRYLGTKEQMKEIVGHKIHHNCMMHGIRPRDVSLDMLGDAVLMLDGITSAENVGSIVRSCVALGVNSLVISKETPHPFNRRALRVSMGHATMINLYLHQEIKESIKSFQKKGYKVFCAEVSENSTFLQNIKITKKWVLIVGHEGRGIAEDIQELCDEIVTIEMQEGIKSFNVGVAASILMYAFQNKGILS